ncbi:MAG: TRAP transporter substrate-binding protein [Pseudorhodoplanes sp.]|uniref:TRAP transporter substrate-binding protein n=1 Tax=Pseudorhodoplanes sp. TaxID=1934341 RepID=UPI003D0F3B06
MASGLLAAVASPAIRRASAQAPVELKFTSYVGVGHGHHKRVLEPWAKMVSEKSGGRLKITIYPGTLGKQADQLQLIQNGIADMGYFVPALTPGRFPLTSVCELPFLFKSGKGGSQAFWALWEKDLQKEGTAAGLKVLWTFIHPPGQLHTTKKSVTNMEDLAGLRIRTAPGVQQDATQRLGATPVVVPFPETYNALDRGVIDGVWFPWEAIEGIKLFEVLKHHLVVNFYTVPFIVAMNETKYAALPADLRNVLNELSGSWAAEFTGAAWDKNDEGGVEAAKKVGATISVLPDAERARWEEKTRPLETAWLDSMKAKNLPGDVVLKDLRDLIKRYDS